MRLTFAPSGEVVVETDDPHQAAVLMREVRNGKPVKKRAKRKRVRELESIDEPLSPALVETWNWLVEHDSIEGAHLNDIATALKLKAATANYRITQLMKKELAHRVSPGYFRAGG